MKKLLFLLLIPLLISCDTRIDANLFSAFKNTDNISVLEAIASGDEDIMRAVYEREKARLQSLDPQYNREEYLQTSLNIADLQSVRSRGVLLFLTLIVSSVDQSEIEAVINGQIIENFLYEVTNRIRNVYEYQGEASGSQIFMALLGVIVYWYYIADLLGTTPLEMIQAYYAGDLDTFLATLPWGNLDNYNDVNEIEIDISENIIEMEQFIFDIESDPDYEHSPDLKRAVENVKIFFGIGG